jgi:hypothetical protein
LPENVFLWYCIAPVAALFLRLIPVLGFLAQVGVLAFQFYVLNLLKNAAVSIVQASSATSTPGPQRSPAGGAICTGGMMMQGLDVLADWTAPAGQPQAVEVPQ